MNECVATNRWTVVLINGLFQAAVLFSFLTAFYALYASKIETKATSKEFEKLVKEQTQKGLEEANKKSNGAVKGILTDVRPALKVLERQYAGPEQVVTTYNGWLFRTGILVSVFLAVALIGTILVLKFSCGHCPSSFLFDIIKSDILIFLVVGVVEFLFFTHVALKLIPAPPSLMVNRIISDIKTKIFKTK